MQRELHRSGYGAKVKFGKHVNGGFTWWRRSRSLSISPLWLSESRETALFLTLGDKGLPRRSTEEIDEAEVSPLDQSTRLGGTKP